MSNKRIVGKCGHCGGIVTVPTMWHSVNPPIPECESCGAQVDQTANMPTLPMKPKPQRTSLQQLIRHATPPRS